jgi:hypothetical protein
MGAHRRCLRPKEYPGRSAARALLPASSTTRPAARLTIVAATVRAASASVALPSLLGVVEGVDAGAQLGEVAQRVIHRAVPAAVLAHQRQLDQRTDRPVGAQHRVGQLEQRIRPRGQCPVELLPEPAEITPAGRGVLQRGHRLRSELKDT